MNELVELAKSSMQAKIVDLHSKIADVSVPADADLKPKLLKLHIAK